MKAHCHTYCVEKMSRALKVSKGAYYHWLKTGQSAPRAKTQLVEQIIRIYRQSNGRYGSPRITAQLHKQGQKWSPSWVARLMKENGLRSVLSKKYVVTTDSKHSFPIAPNVLKRKFNIDEIGKVWVSDITYIKVGNRWNYLTSIIDLADRKVIGWAVSNGLSAQQTVIEAWKQARKKRTIKPGFIFHCDRGVQYACQAFTKVLKGNLMVKQSMARKANCWDNAVAESFFKTIKYEMINHQKFENTQELKIAVFEYIEGWYNAKRIHSAINYLTPNEKEKQLINQIKKVA